MNLKCPHCGFDGSTEPRHRSEAFLYLEDIVCFREVHVPKTKKAKGVIQIDGLYKTGDGFDDGTNPRLMCGNCLHEFPVPEGVELEFE